MGSRPRVRHSVAWFCRTERVESEGTNSGVRRGRRSRPLASWPCTGKMRISHFVRTWSMLAPFPVSQIAAKCDEKCASHLDCEQGGVLHGKRS